MTRISKPVVSWIWWLLRIHLELIDAMLFRSRNSHPSASFVQAVISMTIAHATSSAVAPTFP